MFSLFNWKTSSVLCVVARAGNMRDAYHRQQKVHLMAMADQLPRSRNSEFVSSLVQASRNDIDLDRSIKQMGSRYSHTVSFESVSHPHPVAFKLVLCNLLH